MTGTSGVAADSRTRDRTSRLLAAQLRTEDRGRSWPNGSCNGDPARAERTTSWPCARFIEYPLAAPFPVACGPIACCSHSDVARPAGHPGCRTRPRAGRGRRSPARTLPSHREPRTGEGRDDPRPARRTPRRPHRGLADDLPPVVDPGQNGEGAVPWQVDLLEATPVEQKPDRLVSLRSAAASSVESGRVAAGAGVAIADTASTAAAIAVPNQRTSTPWAGPIVSSAYLWEMKPSPSVRRRPRPGWVGPSSAPEPAGAWRCREVDRERDSRT